MTSVAVWNEFRHERDREEVAEIYPEGIHTTIAEALDDQGYNVQMATLDDPEHGLTETVIANTDVLVWWGHRAHDEVQDEVVDRVVEAIHGGLGFIPLHAAKNSKVFRRLMGPRAVRRSGRLARRSDSGSSNPAIRLSMASTSTSRYRRRRCTANRIWYRNPRH